MFTIPNRGRLAAALAAALIAATIPGAGVRHSGAAEAAEPAAAQGGALSLDDALRLARERNLARRAASLSTSAARAQTRDAGRLANPLLSATLENVGGSLGTGRAEGTLGLEQPLELGGDRSARAGLSGAVAGLQAARESELVRALDVTTVERFCDAWVLQRRVERLRAAENLAGIAVEVAGERLKAGAAPAYERTRAEGYLTMRELERRRAESELTVARRRLAVQWGDQEAAFDSLVLPDPTPPALPPAESLEVRLASHPSRLRALAERDAEDWRAREARAARVPDLQLGAGVRHLADVDGTGFVVGLSLPLPLWNQRGGAVAAAESERAAAEARERQTALDLRAELHGALERYASAVDFWTGVRDRAHPAAREALRLLAQGYRSGRLGYLDIQEGQRALLDAELVLIESSADVWRSWKVLEWLLGVPLEDLAPGKERR